MLVRVGVPTAAKGTGVEILGPANAGISRIQDVYRKILYLKGTDAGQVQKVRDLLQRYIEINQGFSKLGIQYEVE